MGVSESANEVPAEPTLVERSERPEDAPRPRVAAKTVDELIALVSELSNPEDAIVAIDEAFGADGVDLDQFAALASVLVLNGVSAFETRHVQSIRRLFDMHAAIEAGSIEVLG